MVRSCHVGASYPGGTSCAEVNAWSFTSAAPCFHDMVLDWAQRQIYIHLHGLRIMGNEFEDLGDSRNKPSAKIWCFVSHFSHVSSVLPIVSGGCLSSAGNSCPQSNCRTAKHFISNLASDSHLTEPTFIRLLSSKWLQDCHENQGYEQFVV
jgi:hypothetical protein